MTVSTSIKITGLAPTIAKLQGLAKRIEEPETKLMRRIGENVVDNIEERFLNQGYGEWPPLKPATVRRKGSSYILVETGAMLASIRIKDIGPGFVRVIVAYGGRSRDQRVPLYHQYGTGRMPQRQIIKNDDRLRKGIGETIAKWLKDYLAGSKVPV